MKIKKILSNCLRLFTTKNYFQNRHKSLIYLIYYVIEINFKSLSLRLNYPKLFFVPTKHLIAAHLYNQISIYFKKINQEFFLFGGTLLGVARGQNASAGSSKDLDIAIIINPKDKKKFLKRLSSYFSDCNIRINKNFDSIHVNFSKYHYYIDIAFIHKNNLNGKYYHNSVEPYPKKMIFKMKDIFPLKKKEIYYKYCFVPNNSELFLNLLFKKNWRQPHKKKQLYL